MTWNRVLGYDVMSCMISECERKDLRKEKSSLKVKNPTEIVFCLVLSVCVCLCTCVFIAFFTKIVRHYCINTDILKGVVSMRSF